MILLVPSPLLHWITWQLLPTGLSLVQLKEALILERQDGLGRARERLIVAANGGLPLAD